MRSSSILTYIVLIFSVAYAFILPLTEDIGKLLDRKQAYEDSLDKALEIETRENDLLAEFNNISSADRKKIETLVPRSVSLVKLVSDIDVVAAKYGISIDKIISSGATTYNGVSPDGLVSTERGYNSLSLGFSFPTSYEKFNDFLLDLERSLRILDVKSVKIGQKAGNTHNYDVEFETYWAP